MPNSFYRDMYEPKWVQKQRNSTGAILDLILALGIKQADPTTNELTDNVGIEEFVDRLYKPRKKAKSKR